MSTTRRQGIFWILTIPYENWHVPSVLPLQLNWIRGQHEIGENGYHHWQLCCAFRSKASLRVVKSLFGITAHAELTKSDAASSYVWKESTRVEGSQFELGIKPVNPSASTDWETIWEHATCGDLLAIPAHIRVRSYRVLRSIAADYDSPQGYVRSAIVYWGPTGTGKSRRAWDEGGLAAYCKDPRTKFWCGYKGEKNVVFDEFRGGIDVAHILRWLDRYPVRVEVKGGSRPLAAEKFWFTSNLEPSLWYPEIDYETFQALERRLEIIKLD